MQFQSNTKTLAQAVAVVGNVSITAPMSGPWRQVLIRANATDKTIFIAGTDGNVATTARIQCEEGDIEKSGSACLPAGTLIEYLKSAPAATTRIEATPTFSAENVPNGTRAIIKSGGSRLSLQGTHPDDFPSFSRRDKLWKWEIDGDELLQALRFVIPCIDQSKGGPYNAISMQSRNGVLELCSRDRNRAAVSESVELAGGDESEGKVIIVPRSSIDALVVALETGKGERKVTLAAIGSAGSIDAVQFALLQDQASYLIRSSLMADSWPDIKTLVAKPSAITIRANRREMEGALRRCRLALGQLDELKMDDPYIELSFQRDRMQFRAMETGGTRAEEEIEALVQGLPDATLEGKMGISVKDLTSGIKAIDVDDVLLDYDSATSFLRVRHPDHQMLHGISPMHLRG